MNPIRSNPWAASLGVVLTLGSCISCGSASDASGVLILPDAIGADQTEYPIQTLTDPEEIP